MLSLTVLKVQERFLEGFATAVKLGLLGIKAVHIKPVKLASAFFDPGVSLISGCIGLVLALLKPRSQLIDLGLEEVLGLVLGLQVLVTLFKRLNPTL